jgi:single-strand DNA-binding protein
MNSLNSIILEGVAESTPSFKHTPKGTAVCKFNVASTHYVNSQTGFDKEIIYIDVEAWGTLGETIYQKLQKGYGIRVVGRIKQDYLTDKEGGIRDYIYIVAEHIEFRHELKNNTEEEIDNLLTNETEEKKLACADNA